MVKSIHMIVQKAFCLSKQAKYSRLRQFFHAVLGETRTDDTDPHTADEFAVFFRDKIDSVRASTVSAPLYEVPFRSTPTLEQFTPVTLRKLTR